VTLLVAGLLLWTFAHVFKRAFPETRARIDERLGAGPAKGAFATVLVLAVVLMVIGYRQAAFVSLYTPPAWTVHLNNLLMIVAVALFGAGKSKGRARSWFRHPMLLGVTVWGFAHLLVNGDIASLVLFGGLIAWANVNMQIINLREGPWQRPEPGPFSGDLRLLGITLVVYAIISAVHAWLGVWPFPR
jgi:uncharacterized membrane protein